MFKVISIGIVLSTIVAGGELESSATTLPPTLETSVWVRFLTPRGFRLSVSGQVIFPNGSEVLDFKGTESITFHASINKPLKDNENGEFSKEITFKDANKYERLLSIWYYENSLAFIGPDDVFYYSIYISYCNQVYQLLNKSLRPTNKIQMMKSILHLKPKRPHFEVTSSTTVNAETNRSCIFSQTVVRTNNVCTGSVIFEDTFDNLNWTKWQRVIKIPTDLYDADFVSFQGRLENSYVSNGQLNIVPSLLSNMSGFDDHKIRLGLLDLRSNCTGNDIEKECLRHAVDFRILPPIVSAKINTKESFSFRYGRVEVRAKLPKGDWLFPLITLDPVSNYYGSEKYKSGQMRVAFIRGNEYLVNENGNQIDGHRLSGGVVLSQGEQFRDVWLQSTLSAYHLGNEFHNYSLVWTNESIKLSVDGNDYATVSGPFSQKASNIYHAKNWNEGGSMAPFDKDFYISLGVSAGGISDFPDDYQTGLRRHLKPWNSTDPRGELRFYEDQVNWHSTWKDTDAGLKVDYIRVYAL